MPAPLLDPAITPPPVHPGIPPVAQGWWAVVVLVRRTRLALVWAVPLLAGVHLFAEFHIDRPFGVAGMVLLAVGFAGLLRSRQVACR